MSYEENLVKVVGDERVKLLLFTLSTCIWCRKTKALLDALGVAYSYVDVDLVEGDAADAVTKEMRKYNPATSFPTIVVNDGAQVILGFEEDKIKECLAK